MAKLQPDFIQRLVEDEFLSTAGNSATLEIRAVFLAVARGCMTSRMKLGAAGGGDMPQWIADAHSDRYKPWAQRQSRDVLAATIDLVVDNQTPNKLILFDLVIVAIEDYGRLMHIKKH